MSTSKEYYDAVAKEYAQISAKRKVFLDRVNDLIIAEAPKHGSYLDVGAGDGARSMIIAQGIEARSCTLLDESAELLGNVPKDLHPVMINGSLLTVEMNEQYDVVTCLWNVLGHLQDLAERDEAVRKIARFAKPGGFVFIDVNNRYNVQEYGVEQVMNNVRMDRTAVAESGWYPIRHAASPTKVYIHDPFELDSLFQRCGLEILGKYYVDYSTGELYSEFWKGQVLYKLQRSA